MLLGTWRFKGHRLKCELKPALVSQLRYGISKPMEKTAPPGPSLLITKSSLWFLGESSLAFLTPQGSAFLLPDTNPNDSSWFLEGVGGWRRWPLSCQKWGKAHCVCSWCSSIPLEEFILTICSISASHRGRSHSQP